MNLTSDTKKDLPSDYKFDMSITRSSIERLKRSVFAINGSPLISINLNGISTDDIQTNDIDGIHFEVDKCFLTGTIVRVYENISTDPEGRHYYANETYPKDTYIFEKDGKAVFKLDSSYDIFYKKNWSTREYQICIEYASEAKK